MSSSINRQKILMGQKDFTLSADEVGGIVLGERRKGFFSVVEPVDTTTNYVENPSFRAGDYPYKSIGTTVDRTFDEGYTEVNSTLSHTGQPDCFPMYGGWCKVTPTDGEDSGMYYSVSLSASAQYTFSCFIAGKKEHVFSVYVTDNSGNIISERKHLIGNKNWQRLHVTFETVDSGTYRLYLIRNSCMSNITNYFYTSFWVCEDNAFLTLPFNGSYEEKEDSPHPVYEWGNLEWCSKSYRYDNCFNSGRERFLIDYGFILEGINGLGVSGINHVLEKTALDGSVWNATKVEAKEFSLSGKIQADTLEKRLELESDLYNLLTSTSKRASHQPTTLIFRVYNIDDNNIVEGQTLYIYCRFNGGIANSITNDVGSYNVNLSFVMEDPYIYSSMHKESYIASMASDDGHLSESSSGDIYKENPQTGKMEIPFDFPSGGIVKGMIRGANGKIYIYGINLDVGIYINQIAVEYDYETNTVVGIGDQDIYSPGEGALTAHALPDGRVIFCGNWESTIDSVANTDTAAIYDPSDESWSSVGGAFADSAEASPSVYKILVDKNENFYFLGDFDTTSTAIYKWDGTSWTSIGTLTGLNQNVNDGIIIMGRGFPNIDSEEIWAVGQFDSVSVSGTKACFIYNIDSNTFSTMGNSGLDQVASRIFYNLDGYVYIAGLFDGTEDGNILSSKVIKHNLNNFIAVANIIGDYTEYMEGTFQPIQSFINNPRTGGILCGINWDKDDFSYPVILPSFIDISHNNIVPGQIYLQTKSLPSNPINGAILYYDEKADILWAYVDTDWDYGAGGVDADRRTCSFVYSDEESIVYNNGELVYPSITITGSGKLLQIYNHQTRKKILFNEYLLSSSEIVTFDLSKYSKKPVKLMSSKSGEITNYIDQSSQINFYLTNGKNDFSAIYFYDDTNAQIYLMFREKYLCLSKSMVERNIL